MKVGSAVTWLTDVVPADNILAMTRRREAPAKDNANEEVADGTAGAGRLFGALAAEEAKWLLVRAVLTTQQTML